MVASGEAKRNLWVTATHGSRSEGAEQGVNGCSSSACEYRFDNTRRFTSGYHLDTPSELR